MDFTQNFVEKHLSIFLTWNPYNLIFAAASLIAALSVIILFLLLTKTGDLKSGMKAVNASVFQDLLDIISDYTGTKCKDEYGAKAAMEVRAARSRQVFQDSKRWFSLLGPNIKGKYAHDIPETAKYQKDQEFSLEEQRNAIGSNQNKINELKNQLSTKITELNLVQGSLTAAIITIANNTDASLAMAKKLDEAFMALSKLETTMGSRDKNELADMKGELNGIKYMLENHNVSTKTAKPGGKEEAEDKEEAKEKKAKVA